MSRSFFAKRHILAGVAPLVLASLAVTLPAQAQLAQPEGPQARAERDPYAPIGFPVGGFRLFPKVTVAETYTDNVFATPNNEVDDFITTIAPSLSLESDFNNHALYLRGGALIGRYWDKDDENFEDYDIGAGGRLDVTRAFQLTGDALYKTGHEERGDPNDQSGLEPTETQTSNLQLGAKYKPSLISLQGMAGLTHRTFDDVKTAAGANVNNSDRDRNEYLVGTRVGYEFLPSYEVFVDGSYNKRDYDDALDDSGFNRDSDGYRFGAGLGIALTNLLIGDVSAGYLAQNYDDTRLKDVTGYDADVGLTWLPTQLTTVRLEIGRTVNETTSANAAGFLTTRYAVIVSHELLRNVVLGASAAYSLDDYSGVAREDDTIALGLSAVYKITRMYSVGAKYDFRDRDSDVASEAFTENMMQVSLTVQF